MRIPPVPRVQTPDFFRLVGNAVNFLLERPNTFNDGTFDGGPLQLGTNYLWIDATGDLRVHTSAPTTDTDGTVVGTQS